MKRRDLTRLAFFSLLSACAGETMPSGDIQAPKSSELARQKNIAMHGFSVGAPVFIRIFKEERILELWIDDLNRRYRLYRRFPICNYSGALGPKLREGDKQSPEGFYAVGTAQLRPHSRYYLGFDIGYPNLYDRAHGHTGSFLMVHGKCVSVGCYAMGDEQIEIIYRFVAAALENGQSFVPVHIFPFRLSLLNLEIHKDSKWYDFWKMLRPGYDYFESYAMPPVIEFVSGQYRINYIQSLALH